ncbi:MarR family transcriptional regulator, partial [Escherichia coli]|nr:MarR family transcriptional regulator [Escherichia coli]
SLTNSVDRLEATGLVRRIPHPTDGRTRLLELTTAGQQVLPAARDDLNEKLFARSNLSGTDATEIFEILARFRKASGDFL